MIISEEIRDKIVEEYNEWESHQYGENASNKDWHKDLGAYYTPPEFTIKMLEKFGNLDGDVLDPACGCGGLIAAAIIAGADPKRCYGVELDSEILEICRRRLSRLGVPEKNIHQGDATNEDCYRFEDGYHYDPKSNSVSFSGRKLFKFGF